MTTPEEMNPVAHAESTGQTRQGSRRILAHDRQSRHRLRGQLRRLHNMDREQLMTEAKQLGAPLELVTSVAETGRLPVPSFAAGGIATPADAALCMALGAEAVFVGSGIFLSEDPLRRARAIVDAVTFWQDPVKLAAISGGLGRAMPGLELGQLPSTARLAARGW